MLLFIFPHKYSDFGTHCRDLVVRYDFHRLRMHKSQQTRVWAILSHINCPYARSTYIRNSPHLCFVACALIMHYTPCVAYCLTGIYIYYDLVALKYAVGFIT